MKRRVIAVTGGGTGGHVYPGIAVIEELKDKSGGTDVVWIGSRNGIEKEIVKGFNIPYYSIPSGKLRRYFSLNNFFDLFRIAAGFFYSLYLLKRLKVDVLFSKGGFVSVPPVIAAYFLLIPSVTHDSDLDPGLATRINSRFVKKILVPYDESAESTGYTEKVLVTGNPVRREIFTGNADEGKKLFEIPRDKKVILVLGGSLGALQINNLVYSIAGRLVSSYCIVHQMGALTFRESGIEGYVTVPFLKKELPHILAAADLVVSRAGAGTLWENGAAEKASILIPLGTGSSRGDQIRNAEYFASRGAAEVLTGEVTPEMLYEKIEILMKDDEKRRRMGIAAGKICGTEAAGRIAEILLEYTGG